jgi:hypothetical protein
VKGSGALSELKTVTGHAGGGVNLEAHVGIDAPYIRLGFDVQGATPVERSLPESLSAELDEGAGVAASQYHLPERLVMVFGASTSLTHAFKVTQYARHVDAPPACVPGATLQSGP